MRIKEGFELRQVCGEYVVIAQGLKNIDFNNMIALNASAATIWKAIYGKDFTVQDMANALFDEYEVEIETALADSNEMLNLWKSYGIIEE